MSSAEKSCSDFRLPCGGMTSGPKASADEKQLPRHRITFDPVDRLPSVAGGPGDLAKLADFPSID